MTTWLRQLERNRIGRIMLNPDIVSRLLGSSAVAQKTRALVMHDRFVTGHPRAEKSPR